MSRFPSSERIIFLLIQWFLSAYTFITLPIYYCIQKPWIARAKNDKIRATAITRSDREIGFRRVGTTNKIQEIIIQEKIDTMEKLFNYAANKSGEKKALGTREILAEEDEMQTDGTLFKKLMLGEYRWRTYTEMNVEAGNFGRGLLELGLKAKDNIALFSETRAEWLIGANGCMKQSMPVVTLYANLGEDALVHAMNETEVTCVITSQELLSKFENILQRTPNVSILIVIENSLRPLDSSQKFADSLKIRVVKYVEVVRLGEKSNRTGSPPTAEDAAIIMYTSGSTGPPKGVMLSHRNIVNSTLSISTVNTSNEHDVCMAFLPLAHVFELVLESQWLVYGLPIGYSSPLTLTDKSSKVKQGCKGDATVLKPTVIVSVPLMLDRVHKGIQAKIESGPSIKKAIFDFAIQYKLEWFQKGYDTPMLNRLLFKPVRELLGGRVRLIFCGGAPLSPESHNSLRAALCSPIQQGYGLTESCAAASAMDLDDRSTGTTGGPLMFCDIKLVNWEEGNYTVNDYPNPRGEIHVGGDNVAAGYYKQPEKTKADFYQENGKWWFRTGDIGEFTPKGALMIVDRKKDLVKLQHGEYVSPSKVESELKTCPFVDNICVYADSTKQFVVAIITPNTEQLTNIALKQQIKLAGSLDEICSHSAVEKLALAEIKKHSIKCRLQKFEIPRAIKLVPDIWTPETGLVTSAFKLKRRNVEARYKSVIDAMYSRYS